MERGGISGSVLDSPALAKGGTLALGSFKPGTGAAADDETDRLSVQIVKGINDLLPGENTPFKMQNGNASDPDFILEGYIEDYETKGHSARLTVDGEIWSRDSGEKILLFKTSAVFNLKVQDPKQAAYQIGGAIARYIGSQANGSTP